MLTAHKNRIAASFGARAHAYESHADLEAHVAARLAGLLPSLERPKVLEIGCGTGFLTRYLLDAYPHGEFLITDIAEPMLEACRSRLNGAENGRTRFAVLDGEEPDTGEHYDLIATSMTSHWFADPVSGLERLQAQLVDGGHLLFATLGPDSFPEWRTVLAARGWPDGIVAAPALPGIVDEEHCRHELSNGLGFFRRMKAIGAATPKAGYRPLTPGALRGALRDLDVTHGGGVTWHFVYGHLRG